MDESNRLVSAAALSGGLVLAAIARAECHLQAEGVQRARIAEHLGFTPGAATTRRLGPQIDELVEMGAVRQFRRHGSKVWGLTPAGRRRLARARRAGQPLELPEAPQHRLWRLAREKAASELDDLRAQLREELGQAHALLDSHAGSAEEWSELALRLRDCCARLATADYCLRQWPEPDDSKPDLHARRRKLDLSATAG